MNSHDDSFKHVAQAMGLALGFLAVIVLLLLGSILLFEHVLGAGCR